MANNKGGLKLFVFHDVCNKNKIFRYLLYLLRDITNFDLCGIFYIRFLNCSKKCMPAESVEVYASRNLIL